MLGWFVLGCLVAGSTIGICSFFFVRIILVKELKKMSRVAENISRNDLTYSYQIESHDVFGEIADSLKRMAGNLVMMISKISLVTTKLYTASEVLSSTAIQTDEAAKTQQHETQLVANAINQMTLTSEEVARHTEEAVSLANEIETLNESGNQTVGDAAECIETMANEVISAANELEILASESRDMEAIISMISDVAEQTNLLALNAAIEAARAGEQGRGFAVVADEVRTLANRTHNSTEEISTKIEKFRTGSLNASDAITSARERALQSVEKFKNLSSRLGEISTAIKKIADMNRLIATATHEQTNVAQEINNNITNITNVSEETAVSAKRCTEESASTREMALELKDLVASFTLMSGREKNDSAASKADSRQKKL